MSSSLNIYPRGKKLFILSRDGPVKSTETRQGYEKNSTLLYYRVMAPSSQASSAMHLYPYRTSSLWYYTTKWTIIGMQVDCVGDQRGGRHHSVVRKCSSVFSSLPCFCTFYRYIPT